MNTSVTLSIRLVSSTESTGSSAIGTAGSKSCSTAAPATAPRTAPASSSHMALPPDCQAGRGQIAGLHCPGCLADKLVARQERGVVQAERPAGAKEHHQGRRAGGVVRKVVGPARTQRGVDREPCLA